jgi:hypothetical protein
MQGREGGIRSPPPSIHISLLNAGSRGGRNQVPSPLPPVLPLSTPVLLAARVSEVDTTATVGSGELPPHGPRPGGSPSRLLPPHYRLSASFWLDVRRPVASLDGVGALDNVLQECPPPLGAGKLLSSCTVRLLRLGLSRRHCLEIRRCRQIRRRPARLFRIAAGR